jgi:hypothetical protein
MRLKCEKRFPPSRIGVKLIFKKFYQVGHIYFVVPQVVAAMPGYLFFEPCYAEVKHFITLVATKRASFSKLMVLPYCLSMLC